MNNANSKQTKLLDCYHAREGVLNLPSEQFSYWMPLLLQKAVRISESVGDFHEVHWDGTDGKMPLDGRERSDHQENETD